MLLLYRRALAPRLVEHTSARAFLAKNVRKEKWSVLWCWCGGGGERCLPVSSKSVGTTWCSSVPFYMHVLGLVDVVGCPLNLGMYLESSRVVVERVAVVFGEPIVTGKD